MARPPRIAGEDADPSQTIGGQGVDPAASIAIEYSGLDAKVLVLNRAYAAVRVISARRAFVLLARECAEIIDADNGSYANYDLETWTEMSELRRQFEPNAP
jgi:hypothetical protein